MRLQTALWFLAALLVAPAGAQTKLSIAGGRSSMTVPFQLVDNRVFVEVQINGRGPFHFILDTGAGGFSVIDEVAKKLGLKVKDAGEENGVGEKSVRTGQSHLTKIELGELELEDVEATVFPGIDPGKVFGKQPVDGIVGLTIFERAVVKHDYIRHVLTFTLPEQFHYQGAGTVVQFERPVQIPEVEADLDGVRGKFGVDTGARSSMLLYGPFAEQNRLKEKYGAKLEGVTGWGLGGPVRSLLGRARRLTFGGVAVQDLVVRLSTQKTGLTTSSAMAGLIGPDVLSQFDLTVDYSRNQLIFEKNANYGRPDSYDRAGMWMGQDGERFTVVDVIAGGPADAAGVRQGEKVLAIDGVPTANLVLPEVREKVRRTAVGTKMTVLLESDGKQRTAIVTLRDLV